MTRDGERRGAPAPSPPGCADDLVHRLAALDSHDPRRIAVRHQVVESHLPLVHHLAGRFRGRGEPFDDLVQVGTIGLLNAIDRFDPGRGSFTAFAVPTILGEIRRHFRDRGWAMRVPRRLQDLGRRVSMARDDLTQQLGRSPTVQDLAIHLDEDSDLILEALESTAAYTMVPLPTTPEEAFLAPLGVLDEGLALVEDRAVLRPLLAVSRTGSGPSWPFGSSAGCPSPGSPPRSASPRCTCPGYWLTASPSSVKASPRREKRRKGWIRTVLTCFDEAGTTYRNGYDRVRTRVSLAYLVTRSRCPDNHHPPSCPATHRRRAPRPR